MKYFFYNVMIDMLLMNLVNLNELLLETDSWWQRAFQSFTVVEPARYWHYGHGFQVWKSCPNLWTGKCLKLCDTEAKMPTIRKTMKTINMHALLIIAMISSGAISKYQEKKKKKIVKAPFSVHCITFLNFS